MEWLLKYLFVKLKLLVLEILKNFLLNQSILLFKVAISTMFTCSEFKLEYFLGFFKILTYLKM